MTNPSANPNSCHKCGSTIDTYRVLILWTNVYRTWCWACGWKYLKQDLTGAGKWKREVNE